MCDNEDQKEYISQRATYINRDMESMNHLPIGGGRRATEGEAGSPGGGKSRFNTTQQKSKREREKDACKHKQQSYLERFLESNNTLVSKTTGFMS